MGFGGAIGAIAGGVLGAAAGGQKDKSIGSSSNSETNDVILKDFNDLNKGRSQLEQLGYDSQVSGFQDLSKLLQMGPGQEDITNNLGFQRSFADQLQTLLQNVGNPTQQDMAANFSQAQQLFAPQQTALNQQFQDQMTASNRLSARLGRSGADPILRNKLLQEQSRQQTMLNAQMGSYAMQLPQQRAQQFMDIGSSLSNLRSGLATQALQNRQTLMSMGSQLAQNERNYRLATAKRTGVNNTHNEFISGGGFKGAVEGGIAGASAGAKLGGMGGGMPSGGVGG